MELNRCICQSASEPLILFSNRSRPRREKARISLTSIASPKRRPPHIAHNFEAWIRAGATFYFTLPLKDPKAALLTY